LVEQLILAADNLRVVDGLAEELENHYLELEAAHVSVVGHHSEGFAQDSCVEVSVEDGREVGTFSQNGTQGLHTFEAQLH